jgi:hypothetical protein
MRKRLASIALTTIFAAAVLAGPVSGARVVKSVKTSSTTPTVVAPPKAQPGGHMNW